MAKLSMIEREKKRAKTVAKYAEKRARLKAVIANPKTSDDDKWQAQVQLQKLPRDASPVRKQTRCRLTGRPHAVYRKLKLSRIMLRDLASFGQIPGMVKSSW